MGDDNDGGHCTQVVCPMIGTYAGLRAVFVRHYAGNMIEIRVPGGLIVVDKRDFLL